ncbi:MAG: hypothetical protein EXS35_01510 [Pedosphaera sp.]|nr:hypothetical protein [Pedosphaera sp.]
MNLSRQIRWVGFGLVAAWLAFALPARTLAQGTLFTVLTNGPWAKRINIVVFAEGYTSGQTNLFLTDATNAVNNLLAQPPFQEYKSYFNAYAIFVASAQTGADHPIAGTFKNTYFNSSFDSYGISQLLTIPPNDFDGTYANGQGKVDNLLLNLFPANDLVMMVVNDHEYGGSGGNTLITSVNLFAPEIIVHESGHTFGALTDEYTNAYAGYVPAEKPNATAITSSNSIKWKDWIPGGTLIPTPDVSSNDTRVGLFQGAQYNSTGWYRPKHNCKMKELFIPFCEVCAEQLIRSIYTQLRPIDAFAPAATNSGIYSTQAVAFSVTPLQPLTHNLAVQWFTNSVAVPGATNFNFNLPPKSLGNGSHNLKAVVSDPTALVKNDPLKLLKQTNVWNVTVSLNELSLISAQYLAGSRFRLTVTGSAPQGFVLQSSTNLLNWSPLTTNTLSGGKFDYTNSGLTNIARRFYRAVSPP